MGKVKLGESTDGKVCTAVTDELRRGQILRGDSNSGQRRRRRRHKNRAYCIDVPDGCQVQRRSASNLEWDAVWTPGLYTYADWRDIFQDSDETELVVENFASTCVAAEERPNLPLEYSIGESVTEWGCGCVGDSPLIWKDSVTELYYVVEEVGSICEEPFPADKIMNSGE